MTTLYNALPLSETGDMVSYRLQLAPRRPPMSLQRQVLCGWIFRNDISWRGLLSWVTWHISSPRFCLSEDGMDLARHAGWTRRLFRTNK